MSKGVLVAAGLVVVAGIVALVFLLGGGSDRGSARGGQVSSSQASNGGENPSASGTGGTSDHRQPTLPDGTGIALPAGNGDNREYKVGNMTVRDHRSGNSAPSDVPLPVHPSEGHQIPSTLTHEIAQKVKAVMKQCTADVPKDSRGPKPRLEGQILIAIKDQKLTITKSVMQLRDMFGDSVEATKQCIEQKTVGLDNPAIDQPDLADYTINITFAIP